MCIRFEILLQLSGSENVSGLGAGKDSLGKRLLIPLFQIKIFCSSSGITLWTTYLGKIEATIGHNRNG